MNDQKLGSAIPSGAYLKFAIASIVGLFLFLVPLPYQGAINIPLGMAIDFFEELLVVGEFNISRFLVLAFIAVSTLFTLLAYTVKPGFIMNSEKMKSLFMVSPLYFISRIVGLVLVVMIYFGIGPDFIIGEITGDVMMGLAASLVSVFLILAFAIPLLVDFGLMEFIGILIKKALRLLFTLPGRASVDLMASWFGSSTVAVVISTGQYERGKYTGREAAIVCTNFSIVSIPFCFIVWRTINASTHEMIGLFPIMYLILCITGFILALILPRVWPLNRIPDTYDDIAGKTIDEEVPQGETLFKWAANVAAQKAEPVGVNYVLKSAVSIWGQLYLDLIPLVIAWGTIALVIAEYTPVFTFLAWPFGQYMNLFGIPGAIEIAPAALIGFIDMFIPAFMLQGAALEAKFIVGALSLIQIIYITEVGILIIKSRLPVNIGHLFIIFLERTILSLPIIWGLTKLLVTFPG